MIGKIIGVAGLIAVLGFVSLDMNIAVGVSDFEACVAGDKISCDKIASEKRDERLSGVNMSDPEERESAILNEMRNDPSNPLYDILNSK